MKKTILTLTMFIGLLAVGLAQTTPPSPTTTPPPTPSTPSTPTPSSDNSGKKDKKDSKSKEDKKDKKNKGQSPLESSISDLEKLKKYLLDSKQDFGGNRAEAMTDIDNTVGVLKDLEKYDTK